MSEERKIILNLLEKGSISNEDAFKLLEALDNTKTGSSFNIQEELDKLGKSTEKYINKAQEKFDDAVPHIQSGANKAINKAQDALRILANKTSGKSKNDDIFEHDDFL